jgi:hypothetical protein
MIGVQDTPRIAALKKVFAAYRADTSPLVARAYLDELADIPDDVLVKAINEAIKGEAFMPTVARIRTYADKVKPALPALPEAPPQVPASHYLTGDMQPIADDDPRLWVYCTRCGDTGMAETVKEFQPPYTMPVAVGQKDTIERRAIAVERRSYFAHCHCRATNPKLVAQRQRTAKYSREAEK